MLRLAGRVAKRKLAQRQLVRHRSGASRIKTVEETYVKKTPIEHILLRPDLYVGPVATTQATMWTPERLKKKGRSLNKVKMRENDLTYSPALLKIFDEVLVNAVDNVSRQPERNLFRVAEHVAWWRNVTSTRSTVETRKRRGRRRRRTF